MIPFSTNIKVFVFNKPVDLRKGHSSLGAIVQSTMNLDILTGCLFVSSIDQDES